MNTRLEKDSLGEVEIPANRLFGSNTLRALANFPIQDKTLGDESYLVTALGQIKKACALANASLDIIDHKITNVITQACNEMINGALDEHLVVPLLEGSGGTSTNMNVNEVIANRALQLMGKQLADYQSIHPNDHVNLGQSTNDVIPSALKLAAYAASRQAIQSLENCALALENKAEEFSKVYRLGRTCLQDAQPMTLGQAFSGYGAIVRRTAERLIIQRQKLLTLPLGGTAIGTGLGSHSAFPEAVFKQLRLVSGLDVIPSTNLFDGMQNLDEIQRLSSELEVATSGLGKIAKDLIILSSGPSGGMKEINLPELQPGSSIMPGKINPVIPMSVVQLAHLVHGNHCCIVMACQDGMLEINHYENVIASRILDSLRRTAEIVSVFATHCIAGITANEDRCLEHLINSYALATTLVPRLGYAKVSEIVKQSTKSKRTFIEITEELGLIDKTQLEELIEQTVTLR